MNVTRFRSTISVPPPSASPDRHSRYPADGSDIEILKFRPDAFARTARYDDPVPVGAHVTSDRDTTDRRSAMYTPDRRIPVQHGHMPFVSGRPGRQYSHTPGH